MTPGATWVAAGEPWNTEAAEHEAVGLVWHWQGLSPILLLNHLAGLLAPHFFSLSNGKHQ